ncbi:hypothetical protein DICPUDRAFT_87182 [Dictyostelium purpureum]|uniref:DUS-like FMN-binding domain-containing protein n=1 Tax=Dictyostelium purpureum TaxID=5786 RepID=F0ZGI6_DICPU|nr:uncharacterized protein DICPUDRAFT_87182 [Dictyostelium purpureum]EGC36964.1 hypothetical protein DICPUDRAFT_87182 [Dictyostelium purpureum]|eukprot:XP_003286532.1 hypothetical protein DICPUDRAFT_87182 [Dictyostelium purpureum]
MTFWNKLSKPLVSLAPMADVTEVSFRFLIANVINKYWIKPNNVVLFNEFLATEGVCRDHIAQQLEYSEIEKPIVAQFFGCRPEAFKISAEIACNKYNYDGIDINMGCPSRKVVSPKQAAGAALITNPKLAQEIIYATKEGAGSKPVSVKTRIGFDSIDIESWIPKILEAKPSCLTLHLRTKKELSLVPAHWEHEILDRVLEMRNSISPETLIMGNGDVETMEQAYQYSKEFGIDGVMIGRANYGNPWLLNPNLVFEYIEPRTTDCGPNIPPTENQLKIIEKKSKNYIPTTNGDSDALIEISIKEILSTIVMHAIYREEISRSKSLSPLNAHFKNYLKPLSNLGDVSSLRKQLYECKSSQEISDSINSFLTFKKREFDHLIYTEILNNTKNLINSSKFYK